MKRYVPRVLLQGQDPQTAIDAIYFAVRVLRNSSRGYPNTPVSTEPTREARRLAEQIISEIESKEHEKIPAFSDSLLDEYIDSLENYIRSISVKRMNKNIVNKATKVLNEMRFQKY